jgi:hypothetical protein
MICTLIPDFLPSTPETITANTAHPRDTNIVTVWDLEEDAWRSFKPSKITNISFSPE